MLALAVVAGAGAKTKAVKTLPQLRFDPSIGETRILTILTDICSSTKVWML